MNAKSGYAPPSVSELAAGAVALVAVALITVIGVRSTPRSEPPPLPPASAEAWELASSGASPDESGRSSNDVGAPKTRKPAPRRSPPPEPDRAALATAPRTTDVAGPMVPAAGVLDIGAGDPMRSDSMRSDSTSRWEPQRARAAALPSPITPERDPVNRSDAIAIQGKLHDLGYYPGEGDGVWGVTSHNALRDFKSLNGLPHDDRWDLETEERLWSGRGIPAASTFVGGWAVKATECRPRDGTDQMVTISARGAEANGVKCDFRSLRQEAASRWRARASCIADGRSWSANISLTLSGATLRWSSERGSDIYLRCPKP